MIAWIVAAALAAQGEEEAGRKAFNRCASCHAVPDLRLRWDRTWYDLVASSPCAAPPPGTAVLDDRRALLAFLASEKSPRPTRVEVGAAAGPDEGTVTANIEEGYVLLAPRPEKPKKGEPTEILTGYRLVWKKDEKERRRPLPAGTYYVRRYVASRDDPKTGEWTLMATGIGRPVEVKAGQDTKVTLDLDVTFEARPGRSGGKFVAAGAFKGDRDMGLSVFKNNRRLEIGWKITDQKQDLAAGGCTYGPEGVFSGSLDVKPGQRVGTAKYYFDIAMFKVKGDPHEKLAR